MPFLPALKGLLKQDRPNKLWPDKKFFLFVSAKPQFIPNIKKAAPEMELSKLLKMIKSISVTLAQLLHYNEVKIDRAIKS